MATGLQFGRVPEGGTNSEIERRRLVENEFLQLLHSTKSADYELRIQCRVKLEFQALRFRIVTPAEAQLALPVAEGELTNGESLIAIQGVDIKRLEPPVLAAHFVRGQFRL